MRSIVSKYQLGPGQFRILLAAAVLVSHLIALEIGRVAVMLFFVLSGYWVTAMFQQRHGSLAPREVLSFYAGRFLRVLPTYWIVLGLTLLGHFLIGKFRAPSPADLTLLGLSGSPHMPIILPAWSLDIELQFYLTVPFFCALIGRNPSRAKVAALVVAALAITAVAWLIGYAERPSNLGYYAVAFAAGAASFFGNIRVTRNAALASLALFFALGVVALALAAFVPDLRWLIIKRHEGPVDRDVVALIWAASLVPFIYWNVRLPSGKVDRAFGDLAFTLYLTQWFFTRNRPIFGLHNYVLTQAACILAVIVASLCIYFVIERPLEHHRKRLVARLPHRPSSPDPTR